MVNSCAAYNCTERYRKGGVTFHSFPTSQDLRDKWIKALRRSNFTPNQYSKLCAKHFTPDCYETAPWSFMKRLKEGAVPTVFEFSQKRKYQKKSLEESSTKSQDRELGVILPNIAEVPKLPSPSRRKQLIVERKDLNANDLPSIKSVSSFSKEIELSLKTENFFPLPTKRFRKKKTFPSDFVCEDWASRKKARDKKSENLETKDLDAIVGKLGLVGNDNDTNISEAEKDFFVQNDPSVLTNCKDNGSFVEISKHLELYPETTKGRKNIVCGVKENIFLNLEMNVLDVNLCPNVSCTLPGESSFKDIRAECSKVHEGKEKSNILAGSDSFDDHMIQKHDVIDDKKLDNRSVNVEDISQTNNSVGEKVESDDVSEIMVTATSKEYSHSEEEMVRVKDNTNEGKQIDDLNMENVEETSILTSNQKATPVLKLKLDEEEAVLRKCIQLGEASKRKKILGLKKIIKGKSEESVSDSQILNNLSSKEDEEVKNWNRKSYFGDFKEKDLTSPEKAAKCLKIAEKLIREKTMKIKTLRQRERRLMQKVEELENVIFHLVEKRMNPEEASTVLIVLKEND